VIFSRFFFPLFPPRLPLTLRSPPGPGAQASFWQWRGPATFFFSFLPSIVEGWSGSRQVLFFPFFFGREFHTWCPCRCGRYTCVPPPPPPPLFKGLRVRWRMKAPLPFLGSVLLELRAPRWPAEHFPPLLEEQSHIAGLSSPRK